MPGTQKKSVNTLVSFQLKGIELLDFCFNHPKELIPAQMVFNFEIKIEHKILADNNFIAVVVSIDIYNDQRRDIKLGSIMVSCIFEIPQLKEYIDPKNKVPKLPEDFLTTINSISISTVRGVMFSQFRGTFLHNAILPVVDPKSFVSQK
jgi:hypothetical protein